MLFLRSVVILVLVIGCLFAAATPVAQAAGPSDSQIAEVVTGPSDQLAASGPSAPTDEDTLIYPVPLYVSRNGNGVVTSSPAGIGCGDDCSEEYANGTEVTLSAQAAEGHYLSEWQGACTGKALTCTVTLQNYTYVYVYFYPITYDLNLYKSGAGFGTISGVADHDVYGDYNFSCDQECPYDSREVIHGTKLVLNAIPSPGYVFSGWEGACTGNQFCNTTMLAAKEITATFSPPGHTVIVNKIGDGAGAITSVPSGIACGTDCAETFAHGQAVTLNAVADAGSVFTGWSGACNGTSPTCAFITDGDRQIAATFAVEQPGEHILTVTKTGSGSGTVTSEPEGIACGNDCLESYSQGADVILEATADSGSTFAGWSGACTGTNACDVTIDAAKSVTASFAMDKNENAVFLPAIRR